MSIDGLRDKYTWSSESEARNELTAVYEPVQPFVLLAMTHRLNDAIFIDAGANIGFYTVVIGSEETVSEVIAVEPMPEAVAALRWNAQANLRGTSVAVHQLALSAQPGELSFAVRSPLAGDNGALQDTALAAKDFHVEKVRCERLDDVLTAVGREVVIKVDVEGHELSLLEGAQRTLRENRGFLQIEMHPSPLTGEKIALLNDLGWHQVAQIRSDYYFSNVGEYMGRASFTAEILEDAMGLMVDASKGSWRESRRRLAAGVYLHLSRSKVDAIKGLLTRGRFGKG